MTVKRSPLSLHEAYDDDVNFGMIGHRPQLIPHGKYSVGFVRVEKGHVHNRERWFLYFRITTPGPYFGIELYYSCPCPTNGKFGLSSKMVAAATVALGHLPTRRDRLSSTIFKGKHFLVLVRTVDHDQDGNQRAEGDHYSVIGKFLELEAGAKGPPSSFKDQHEQERRK